MTIQETCVSVLLHQLRHTMLAQPSPSQIKDWFFVFGKISLKSSIVSHHQGVRIYSAYWRLLFGLGFTLSIVFQFFVFIFISFSCCCWFVFLFLIYSQHFHLLFVIQINHAGCTYNIRVITETRWKWWKALFPFWRQSWSGVFHSILITQEKNIKNTSTY